MQRLGLALSGGGFRATLYHLGVVRFLSDAKILPKVTHITTVSGGSILGAHLALNWQRYCGSSSDFEQAAGEILRFVQLDVRNRIVRRFPLASVVNLGRQMLFLGSDRRLTRPGLLERHYEDFLYGDTCLFQLPESPRLHILATNISEGCLCSFHRNGLLMQRRMPGRSDRFERVKVGLATVPMAVAASSAFPGFFPPLSLRGWDVGAKVDEFDRQAFIDGGVFDNLGVRMFRCMEQAWMRDVTPLRREDFLDIEAVLAVMRAADGLPQENPVRRLAALLTSEGLKKSSTSENTDGETQCDELIEGLREVITTHSLYRDSSFQTLDLLDPDAQTLLRYLRSAHRTPEWVDHLWLNRQLLDAALRQVVGRECLRASRPGFDMILVSDAGSEFRVAQAGRSGGLVRTALRSSDILMDRVWQLEMENFHSVPGFTFASIGEIVSPSQDPTAPHPEIQRQAARIRTDLDRFSGLEIQSLVRHGYSVARKACRSQADHFGRDLPSGPPWEPLQAESETPAADSTRPDAATVRAARRLRRSSSRRIFRTLLDFRDWPSYVWLPIFALLLWTIPYAFYTTYRRAEQSQMVVSAMAQASPLYDTVLERLRKGPVDSLVGLPYTDVTSMSPPDLSGFQVVTDARVFDLRAMHGERQGRDRLYQQTRLRVHRADGHADNTHLRIQRELREEELTLFCRNARLRPTLTRLPLPGGTYLWQLDLDFSRVPVGEDVDVIVEFLLTPEVASQTAEEGRFNFSILTKTGLAKIWVLMPSGMSYESFEISKREIGKPNAPHDVVATSKVELPLGELVTLQLVDPDVNFRYECHWTWQP